MSINIKTENGLKILADRTTKATIEAALGDTPIVSKELTDKLNTVKTTIDSQIAVLDSAKADVEHQHSYLETNSDKFQITDRDGNISIQVDESGLTASNLLVGKDQKQVALQEEVTKISNNVNNSINTLRGTLEGALANKSDLNHTHESLQTETDKFQIVDYNGNIALQLDENGLNTTNVLIKNKQVALADSVEQLETAITENINTKFNTVQSSIAELNSNKAEVEHIHNYSEINNAPDIREDSAGNLQITDEDGNIILKVDSNGLTTTRIFTQQTAESLEEVATKAELDIARATLEGQISSLNSNKADKITVDTISNTTIPSLEQNIATKATKEEVIQLQSTTNSLLNGLRGDLAALDAKKSDDGHTHSYTELVNAPSISEEDSSTINVVDDAGNIIMSVDSTGVNSVAFKVNGEAIEAMTEAEILAIVNEVFPPEEYNVEE